MALSDKEWLHNVHYVETSTVEISEWQEPPHCSGMKHTMILESHRKDFSVLFHSHSTKTGDLFVVQKVR